MKAIDEVAKNTIGKLISVQIDVTNEESVQNAVHFVQKNLDSKLSAFITINIPYLIIFWLI